MIGLSSDLGNYLHPAVIKFTTGLTVSIDRLPESFKYFPYLVKPCICD